MRDKPKKMRRRLETNLTSHWCEHSTVFLCCSHIPSEYCNVPFRSPADILRNLYGYACGDKGNVTDCNVIQIAGQCRYASRKQNFLVDKFVDFAKLNVKEFSAFSTWLRSSMMLALFHHGACLPLEQSSCNDKTVDPVFNKTTQELEAAVDEVIDNLGRVEYCFKQRFRETINPVLIVEKINVKECLTNITFQPLNPDCTANFKEECKNLCMAKTIIKYFEDINATAGQFFDHDWMVTVFSFSKDEDKSNRDIHDYAGEERYEYGYKQVELVDLGGGSNKRNFHFMYRLKNITETKKEYFIRTNFDYEAPFRRTCSNDACYASGIDIPYAYCNEADNVFAKELPNRPDVFCPTNYDLADRSQFAAQHGFIVFAPVGIPRAFDSTNFASFETRGWGGECQPADKNLDYMGTFDNTVIGCFDVVF